MRRSHVGVLVVVLGCQKHLIEYLVSVCQQHAPAVPDVCCAAVLLCAGGEDTTVRHVLAVQPGLGPLDQQVGQRKIVLGGVTGEPWGRGRGVIGSSSATA
jgi:hypothetical protein